MQKKSQIEEQIEEEKDKEPIEEEKAEEQKKITIFICGDSTAATRDVKTIP